MGSESSGAQLGPYLDAITDQTPGGVYQIYTSAPGGVRFEATVITTSTDYFVVTWHSGTWNDSTQFESIAVAVSAPLIAILESGEAVITGPVVWIITQP